MKKKVYNFDKSNLNKKAIYCGKYDMPYVKSSKDIPIDVITFEKALKTNKIKDYTKWIVFYSNDSEFERFWNCPQRYLEKLKKFKGVVTPDFSLSRDMPYPVKIMNTYRSKWLGAWLNENDIKTIVNVRWCDEESFEYVFDGIEENSNIFIGTLGCRRNNKDRLLLEKGFEKTCRVIKPKFIMSYGYMTEKMKSICNSNSIGFKEYTPQITSIFGGAK